MKRTTILLAVVLAGMGIRGSILEGQTTQSSPIVKEAMMNARGTFEVKVTPQPADEGRTEPFGRLLLDKQFHGDLEAVSAGQMLGAQSAVKGSGGYVAMEIVTGTLHGKRGSFILQHNGTMRASNYVMNIAVVPDSGTEELAGIAGTMTIVIEGNKHSYDLVYTFE